MSANLPLSHLVRDLPPYPFAHLDTLKRETAARGVDIIDLSIGDPGEEPPANVLAALRESVGGPSVYPRALGRPDLRQACAAWLKRRFGVDCDPDKHILPTNGAKEAVYHLPLACVDADRRPGVMLPDPGYPVYVLGIKAGGGKPVPTPLLEENGFLPDLESISEEQWAHTSILWLNYPHNPTGGEADAEFFARAAELCRRHGVLLASDEAYSETYFADPPPSALEQGTENVIAMFTLSKRSALPGLRSGFMAGDERVIEALKRQRPGIGVATPEFIQRAAATAWDDEEHPARLRMAFGERHEVFSRGLAELGFGITESRSTIYVWCRPPQGETETACAERMLNVGVVATPGSAFGEAGKGYLRFSLVVPTERLTEALSRIRP